MALIEQTVSFPGVGIQLSGFTARPEGNGPFPAVVVIHEAFGLNDNIKGVVRRFANEGYAALAADLFAGRNQMVCMARLFSGLLFNSLNHEGIQNLKGTLDYFAAQPEVDSARIGAIGFCMGGSFAIAWASTDPRLKAIAPYYAMNPRPFEAVKRLCPVVASYPGQDFTAGAGKKLDIELDADNIPHDIKVYPGTHHSFFNELRGTYNAEATEDSWGRVKAFFKTHIG